MKPLLKRVLFGFGHEAYDHNGMKALFVLVICLFASEFNVQRLEAQTTPYSPKDQVLFDAIQHMDSVMFDAFNKHDLSTLGAVFAENVEFYNDGGGVSDYRTTMANFKILFERNANTGLKRELVKDSLEVYPVPDFGAIEIGTHRFIHMENGKEEIATMKFIQVWQLKAGVWRVTRVISVGH